MMNGAKAVILIVTALFPIVNPIGGSPVFLALTSDYPTPARKALAWRIALNSFILLVVSFAIGTHVLQFFGISIPVVQVGGGLIVISTGWSLLKGGDERSTHRSVDPNRDIFGNAFYPLTLPLTVGPGSISVAIALGANEPHLIGANLLALLTAAIGSGIIAGTIYLCYGFSDKLAAAVGPTGTNIILRLSSFLLVCIGVQILWNGLSALLKTLPFSAT